MALANKKMANLQRWKHEIQKEEESLDPSAPFFETVEVSQPLLSTRGSYKSHRWLCQILPQGVYPAH